MPIAGLALLFLGACGGSAKQAVDAPTSTTVTPLRASAVLSFREVIETIPYGTATDATAITVPTDPGPTSCAGGHAVTAPADQRPGTDVVLADRANSACYLLGPVLLSTSRAGSADAVVNPSTSRWEVDVHFDNDDFVQKVATPEVNRQVAMVLDGVVQSAPNINPGITGRDVMISGNFDEATARRIASELDP